LRVFVRKHLQRGLVSNIILRFGIGIREWFASIARAARPLRAGIIDFVIINASFILGEYIWFGEIFHFPAYAYPIIFSVPWLIIATTMLSLGVYTTRKYSSSRVLGSVAIGYVIVSALVFFFKQYGFSRMVVLISGSIDFLVLPGWRTLLRMISRSPESRGQSIFGRRTLIVGVEKSAQDILRKLRTRVDHGYNIVGLIDLTQKRIGDKIAGVEILGSIDNISKIAQKERVSDVIFSADILSYTEILAVIAKTRYRLLNYRLVPNSLQVIIGKTHIDELDDIPFVEIEYNIHLPLHRFAKRLFDIIGAFVLLVLVYPWIWMKHKSGAALGRFGQKMIHIPDVVRGTLSFVGPPSYSRTSVPSEKYEGVQYWGKIGLTGLIQINYHGDITPEDFEKYNFYYAKNQSLWLDLEIIVKSILLLLKH
jgi:O-antigen biosynthesis protein